ncbi:MAG TPA: ribonuclease HIII [Acholeplasmataceae bacterium]|nr:MAG: ribonuclease HIII [Tenericutes bacterium GWA2_38_26]OHE30806.1 MAG: ribonuclease HIII [Tenericutes bacterium GWC2_39_45]OHE31951.1 MAG: ribonuclease HIII [Tenericutes bacterium GWD2_38_27]OHE40286.1 MAG: ribonuclease HIII [Tenericutes bacterium GWE2_38_8]HBG33714.1 ribonuclease HIII [Acholeplasmataceae bacterium]
MKHYTISVNDVELEKLNRVYQFHQVEDKNPYLLFHAEHNGIDILAYKTGKVLLQGKEVTHELVSIKKHLNREDYAAIGSDEVGTGDVFGPIVVCALYATTSDIEYLESLNVRDSKNMDDKSIIAIAPKIAKKIIHSLLILPPEKYNELVGQGYNLNKIKALLHNQAIIKTSSKLEETVPVILDQFCTPQLYFNYIKDETLIFRDIDFHVRAEQVHLSVAAASIIARYAFLVKMKDYSEKLGIELLKGASKDVDEQVKLVHEQKGKHTLGLVAKMNFKNVTKQNLA